MLKFGTWPKANNMLIQSEGDCNRNSDSNIIDPPPLESVTELYNDTNNLPPNVVDLPVSTIDPSVTSSDLICPTTISTEFSKIPLLDQTFPMSQEGKDQRIILDQTIPMLPTMLPNMDNLTPIQSNSSESFSSHKSVQPPSYPSCPPNFPVTPSMTNNMSPNTKSIPTTKLPVVSHDGEMSPIHQSSEIKQQNPDNFVTDLNLDTPKLGKGALKKFNKFKGNFYLKSAPQERLDFYIKNSTDKISKPKVANFDELPAIPEEYFEGEPAWEIKEIKKAVENKDGWKYYVRYTGKHKDGWLTNDDSKDLNG